MPVLVRRRTARILIIAAASIPLLLAGGGALIIALVEQTCSGGAAGGDAPSQVAQRDIPARFLAIYEQVGAEVHDPLGGVGRDRRGGVRPGRGSRPVVHAAAGSDRPWRGELRGGVGADADRCRVWVVRERRRCL